MPQSEDQLQRELHFSRVEGTRDHSEIRRSENPTRQSEVRMIERVTRFVGKRETPLVLPHGASGSGQPGDWELAIRGPQRTISGPRDTNGESLSN